MLNATRANRTWTYSAPALGDSTNLNLAVSGGNFTISRSVTSGTNTTTCYFRQTGNTAYSGNADASGRNWTFYKVNETYSYSAPTE